MEPRRNSVIRLDRARAQLLVVDIQTKLLPHIHDGESVVGQTVRMLWAAAALDIPLIVSEQYSEGLGPTTPAVLDAAGGARRVTKLAFSVCGDPAALAAFRAADRPQVLLAGIEAHVCVQQTALDLLAEGLTPVVLADAVGSRRALDRDVAFERMRAAGVVLTTVESAVFEMTQRCDTELFRNILKIVK